MIVYLTMRGAKVMVYQCESEEEAQAGLIGQIIDDDEGLMLPSSSGLHTVGVPIPLDIVWMDPSGKTLAIDENIQPNSLIPSKGPFAVELRGGWFQRHPKKCGCSSGAKKCGCSTPTQAVAANLISTPHGPMIQFVGR